MMIRRNTSIVLVILVFIAISVQYMPIQFSILKSGVSIYWTIGIESLQEVGVFRYVKDIYLIFFSLYWLWLVKKSKNQLALRFTVLFLFYEFLILGLGLIGHLLNPIFELIFLGLRWQLLLHTGFGIFCISIAYSMLQGRTLVYINQFMLLFVFISSAWAGLQWLLLQGGVFNATRLPSFYANAGVFGYAMMGAALYFLSVVENSSKKIIFSGLLLSLFGSVLSGTRASMFVILIIVFSFLFSSLRKKINNTFSISTFIFMAIVMTVVSIILLPIIGDIAGRGRIIESQFSGDKGRFVNLVNLMPELLNAPIGNILFGKGFGFGTNNAMSVFPELIGNDSWFTLIDNTFVTWFLQFGMIGLILLLFGVGLAFIKIWARCSKNIFKIILFCCLGISFFTMCFAQNIFESYHYLLFLSLSISVFYQAREYDQDAQLKLKH